MKGQPAENNDAIAIVGMACRFAASPNPGALWRLVNARCSAIRSLGLDQAMPFGVRPIFQHAYPTAAGLLGDVYAFVPALQEVPRQMNAGENKDLYFATQLLIDALQDASIVSHGDALTRGTVRFAYAPPFTAPTLHWLERTTFLDQTIDILSKYFRSVPAEMLERVRMQLTESLPALDVTGFFMGDTGRLADTLAHQAHFSGAASTFSAGMLSFPCALESAVDDLRSNRADVALAGAVTSPLTRAVLEGYAGDIAFTSAASFVPFDRGNEGTIPGEGGAFFVLKRRKDALDAHDRIYALIRSVAIGGDSPLVTCTERTKVPLSSIQLIEADGSGIPDADAAEVEEVQRLWGDHKPGGPLVGMGSVKGNIGHCLHAASAASLVKVALSIYQRVLPPQMPAERRSERLCNLNSSVYLLESARPWITGNSTAPRRAVVLTNDFGRRRAAFLLEGEPEGRI